MCALGTITSGTGLISGLNINDIVSKLMAIEQKPRDLLKTRTDALSQQQVALTEMTGLL
jgi:flagellar capping protein FliD